MTTLKKVPLAKLVEDFSLYPRHRVEDVHVSDLLRALQSGAELPPIVVEAKTNRIVDGFHRVRAYRKHLGDDGSVEVEMRKYASDAELFMDSVERNSMHGRKLDRHDQVRIVLKLRELHVADQQIAIKLHVPEATVELLAIRIVQAPNGPLPRKQGLGWFPSDQVMTAGQVETMRSVRSGESGRLCLELTRLLESGLVNLEDETVIERLKELAEAITKALQAVAA